MSKKSTKRKLVKQFTILIVLFAVTALLLSQYQQEKKEAAEEVGLNKIVAAIEKETVTQIVVEQNTVTAELNDKTSLTSRKDHNESLATALRSYEVDPEKLRQLDIVIKSPSSTMFWVQAVGPAVISFGLVLLFIFFLLKQVQGSNQKAMMFGQTKAQNTKDNNKKTKPSITFKDVAGNKEAKKELEEVVDFLKNSAKFTAMGARIPKGMLLVGPPGTGKTLLAKAISGEADVPFFHVSGSEFVEMFVGVGAARIRSLFKKAKQAAPSLIFIDEIDAVGRRRGTGHGGSHDEREQTLNQILTEMDGFNTNNGVIILAATNRPDVLDPALLRPGRFDRRVILSLPDINDREAILKVHANNKPLEEKVDLKTVAARTPGFSGADLENLLNEASILAVRQNVKKIPLQNILSSVEKVLLGPERKSHILSPKEKEITAYHEAGHALVSHILPLAHPVHKVSIISRGSAGGYTMNLPDKETYMQTKQAFLDELAVMMGGYAAEKIIYKEVTTGAQSDLQKATQTARKLITDYGMSADLGPRTFGIKEGLMYLPGEHHEHRNYSEKTAEKIDHEISEILSNSLKLAIKTITDNQAKLELISQTLLKKENIEKDDFAKLMEK